MVDDNADSSRTAAPAVGAVNGPPATDAREAPRATLLLRTAKLIADDREFLCIIRDASGSGVRLQLFHPLPASKELVLETSQGDRHAIEEIWNDGKFAGFRFNDPINLAHFIREPNEDLRKRQLRLNVELKGRVVDEANPANITVENLSQQGACIRCNHFFAIDQLVVVEIDKLPRLPAKIRWRDGQRYGLIFEQTFRFEALAKLLAP